MSKDDLLDTTKKYIRGLLTATPAQCTIAILEKDYYEMIGKRVPFQELGYTCLEQFLKAIPDTVHVTGNGKFATVNLISSSKSNHINEMVARQKKPASKRATMPRYTARGPIAQNFMPVQFMNPNVANWIRAQQSLFFPRMAFPQIQPRPLIPAMVQRSTPKPALSKTHHPTTLITKENKNSGVPYAVQDNLKRLIKNYPNGIWCSDLPKAYENLTCKPLDFNKLGFRSLIKMCNALPEIFKCTHPAAGDYKLFDADKEIPTQIEAAEENATQLKQREDSFGLITIDVPSDVVEEGELLPKQFLPKTAKVHDQFDVVVTEVYDPSKFWIYLTDAGLDNLMDDLQKFYSIQSSDFLIPKSKVKPGMYCVSIIFKEFHRALIVEIVPGDEEESDRVKLLFFDYGTLAIMPMEGLYYLHKRFAELPMQQIRCRLANICPLTEGMPWCLETIKRFKDLVYSKDVAIKISSIDREEEILEVYLADLSQKNIVYVNDLLVNEGFAQYIGESRERFPVDPNCAPKVKNIHLFPTFFEIEFGLVPNASHMLLLAQNDVPLNCCFPQYFNIVHSQVETDRVESKYEELSFADDGEFDLSKIKNSKFNFDLFKGIEKEIEKVVLNVVEEDKVEVEIQKQCEKIQKDLKLAEEIIESINKVFDCDTVKEEKVEEKIVSSRKKHILSQMKFDDEEEKEPVQMSSTNPFLNMDPSECSSYELGSNPFLSSSSYGIDQDSSSLERASTASTTIMEFPESVQGDISEYHYSGPSTPYEFDMSVRSSDSVTNFPKCWNMEYFRAQGHPPGFLPLSSPVNPYYAPLDTNQHYRTPFPYNYNNPFTLHQAFSQYNAMYPQAMFNNNPRPNGYY